MIGLKNLCGCATFSTNHMQNQKQSPLGRTRFPALGAGLRVFVVLFVVIGHCNNIALVLRHSIENRSMRELSKI